MSAAITVGAVAALSSPGAGGIERPGTPAQLHAATSVLVRDVADAYVAAGSRRRNFGRRQALIVGRGRRAYLQFRTKRMPASIVSATLRVYATRGGAELVVSRVARRWRERTITFTNAPPVAQPTVEAPVAGVGWRRIDVTSLVGYGGTVDLAVASQDGGLLTIASRESRRHAPQLVLELGDPLVGAGGDIACDPGDGSFNGGVGSKSSCHMRATSELLRASKLTSVLVLGDEQYENGALANFRASYAPTWGRLNAIAHPAPGNHEYETPGAAGYFSYFGRAAGDPSKGYYSFDIGRWHVVSLNSNCSKAGGCNRGSPQEEWLRTDLAAHRGAPCTLAYWHHPRFSSGGHGNTATMQPIWQALYDLGADLVLSGHDHDYERFAPQRAGGALDPDRGLREFVVGTGGRNLTRFRAIRPNSEARSSAAFGILQLTLRPHGYDWRFVPEKSGSFTDSGSAPCH